MTIPFMIAVLGAAAIGFGVWRRFTSVQWIWLMFGTVVVMLIAWLLLLVLVVGPEMRRQQSRGVFGMHQRPAVAAPPAAGGTSAPTSDTIPRGQRLSL